MLVYSRFQIVMLMLMLMLMQLALAAFVLLSPHVAPIRHPKERGFSVAAEGAHFVFLCSFFLTKTLALSVQVSAYGALQSWTRHLLQWGSSILRKGVATVWKFSERACRTFVSTGTHELSFLQHQMIAATLKELSAAMSMSQRTSPVA